VPRKQPADYDPTDVALGGALRVARIRLGLEQEAVGLTLGSPTPGAAQRLVSRLESGEQTWTAANVIAVARALVGNPEVVFADEPTAALDRESGATVVHMLKRLGQARGTTTVMVTHDSRILELADRVVTLEDGRIVKDTDF
jgi:ABC-type ATPase involved in cell division